MKFNERPGGFRRRFNESAPPKPNVVEETIRSEKIQIERKTFVFTLKENARGRFLRITEDAGGRRDTVIIPSTGLDEFKHLLDEMVQASGESPAPPSPT
jgi:hypothetical protein